MTDMWDIARYLEEHPEDHEQRWRLAKKLYSAWEYRHALEHLHVLKNEWNRRLNVNRYLAATLYRLGRYEEAAKELREAIDYWPQEIALHEQLARVLEMCGSREDAAKVWDTVAKMDPAHATAKAAAKRLRERTEDSPREDLRLVDSDSGIHLSPGRVCHNCGAQNSDEFERCWQCHAPLYPQDSGRVTPYPRSAVDSKMLSRENLHLAAGFLTIACFTLAVFLSLRLMSAPASAGEGGISTVLPAELAKSRAGTGLALALLWPAVLLLAVRMVQPPSRPHDIQELPIGWCVITGLLFASLAYLGTWLPDGLVYFAAAIPAILSLVLLGTTFRLGWGRAAVAWVLQLLIVATVTPAIFACFEFGELGSFYNPYGMVPILAQSSRAHGEGEFTYSLPKTTLGEGEKVRQELLFQPSASAWWNARANWAEFRVEAPALPAGENVMFEVEGPTGTAIYAPVRSGGSTTLLRVQPDQPYAILLDGPAGTTVQVTIACLLEIKLLHE